MIGGKTYRSNPTKLPKSSFYKVTAYFSRSLLEFAHNLTVYA